MTMQAGAVAAQSTALSTEDLAALQADLGRLNGLAPGLGDRAVRYVAEGTDTSVLMEINGIGPAALEPFTHYHGVRYVERKELRRRALVDVEEWRPSVLHRFAVFLETMQNRAGRYRYGKFDPKAPSWLRVLIEEVEQIARFGNGVDPAPSVKRFYSVSRLAELVTAAGEPEAALLHHFYGPKNYATDCFSQRVDGLSEYLTAHAELVAATLPHLHADGRERLMHDLGRLKIATGALFDVVFKGAVGASKAVRKAARAILQGAPADRLLDKGAETFASGSMEERRETVELLTMLVGTPARDVLAAHGEREKPKPVRDAIAAALARIGAAPSGPVKTTAQDARGITRNRRLDDQYPADTAVPSRHAPAGGGPGADPPAGRAVQRDGGASERGAEGPLRGARVELVHAASEHR